MSTLFQRLSPPCCRSICLTIVLLISSSTIVEGQVQHWKPSLFRRTWDLKVNPLEFRHPVRFIPFDVKAGLAIYGGPDMAAGLPFSIFSSDNSVAILDSTESEVPTINGAFSRKMLIYDVDLVQVNLKNRWLPISVLDFMVGLGIRTHQIPLAPKVPAEWPSSGENYKFAPVFHTVLATFSFGYQRSPKWYSFLKLTRGYATGSVYKVDVIRRTLKGTGIASDWVLGIKRLGSGESEPRMAVGLELRYHRLDIPNLDVPLQDNGRPISPIVGLAYRSAGLFITFGAYFGGRSSLADQAKQNIYRGDYITAEEQLNSFLLRNPRHGKFRRAKRLLALAAEYAPYQKVDLAREYQQQGDLELALDWLSEAEDLADTTLLNLITGQKEEIGHIYIQRANDALVANDLESTSEIVRIANLLLPGEPVLIKRYESEVLVRKGHTLRREGSLTAALRSYDDAIRIDPGRRVEIEGYKVHVAEDLLRDAATAVDRSALALALESLRLSRELDPRRALELDSMIIGLQKRMDRMSKAEIRRSIEAQMNLARELINRAPPTRPRVGMLVAALEDVLGPADHITQGNDAVSVNHQLWEYAAGKFPGRYYFENYVLKRIEPTGD